MLAEGGKIWNHPAVGAGIPAPYKRNLISDISLLIAGAMLFIVGITGTIKRFSAMRQELDKIFGNNMNTYIEKGDSLVTKIYDSSHIINLATPFIFLFIGAFLITIFFRTLVFAVIASLPLFGALMLFALSGTWATAESSNHTYQWVSEQTDGGKYTFFVNDQAVITTEKGKKIGTLTLKYSENGDTITATIKYSKEN